MKVFRKILSLSVTVIIIAGTACPERCSAAYAYPQFSWDRVPVFAHLGKPDSDFTQQEAEFLAGNFKIVTIEKTQGMRVPNNKAENAICCAAEQLKAVNPNVKVLFYFNSRMDYPMYEASKTFRANPDWILKDKNGSAVLIRGRFPAYDVSNAEVRHWWSDVCSKAVSRSSIDGIFADAVSSITAGAKAKQQKFGKEKFTQLKDGTLMLLKETKRKIGPDKLLIINGLFAKRELAGDSIEQYLDYIDGVMVEHFAAISARDANGLLKPELLALELEMIPKIARKEKLVLVKAFPGDLTWLPSEKYKDLTNEEKLKLAKEKITFPLAAFLIAAEKYCYFGYSWGYRPHHGWFQWYPEFNKPLGPPMGPAKRSGWIYTRDFEHASVWIDIKNEKAEIDWHK